MLVLIKQPEELDYLPAEFKYYVCKENGKKYAYIAIQIINHDAAIHFHSIHWSHNALKILLKDWGVLLRSLKNYGVRYLIASNKNTKDKRWPKFIKLFGFGEPQLVLMSKAEIK